MKKTIAVLLFVLMLVISIPPTMRIHSCGGRLASVSMWSNDKGCGCGKMNHTDTDKNDLNTQLRAMNCCHTSQIGLAVGDYQIQTHDFPLNANTFQCAALVSCILFNVTATSHNISIQSNPPPDPPVWKGTDILTHNCIYRI